MRYELINIMLDILLSYIQKSPFKKKKNCRHKRYLMGISK